MESERKRAWVLLYAENDHEAVENLKARVSEKNPEGVVIRADRVDATEDFPFNIVVPVDADSERMLFQIVDEIVEVTRAKRHAIARVVEHIPFPPQDAMGYITEREFDEGKEKEGVIPGLQGASPGHNPWG
jgi:hypothetical protein